MNQLAEIPDLDEMPSPTGAKTLLILDFLSRHPEGSTASQTARELGLTANLVARLLQTMSSMGYATRREDNKAYVLSNRLLDLARPKIEGKSLVVCSHEALHRLRDETEETVQLVIEANGKALVMEQVSGLHPLQVCGKVGMQVPLYSCAPGKSILSAWSDEKCQSWLKGRVLKSFTPATLSRREDLLDDLDQCRGRGYAIDRAEGIEGIHCVAVAIRDRYNQPIGAITVMAPIARMEESDFEGYALHCLAARDEIELRLRE
ncbi:MAG: IclR family transcriptional regulator [Verrucomicrobiota bacterium]